APAALDASTSDGLAQYVFRYAANCELLILDLTEVTFFGFESFSHLRLISDRCATASVTLTLIPSAVVARVLQICDPIGHFSHRNSMQNCARKRADARSAR